ncbi:hypothetical protein SELMODRAFT_425373 [Selaginella moellendorffii]|uniref:Uncharacterized protein n=1 Tax=Selaginella moellendorffii TaxID=88036 RepID=D8SSW7_SELML|nr:hypothetical protein SELMODRAFT_425373 [Selaginella moellendorffii]
MAEVVGDGSLDHKGNPAIRSATGGWKRAVLVFGPELCERMTTLGVATNLVTYLTNDLHLSNTKAPNIVTNFLGTSFMLCLLGGFIADTYIGRFWTVAIAATIQFLGMLVLTILTSLPSLRPPHCVHDCPPAKAKQLSLLYLALYLSALGTGGIKSNVSAFGADQFDKNEPKEQKLMSYFFNWFFVSISVGALFSLTVLVYIQDNVGRGWGYGICAAAMLLAIVIFLAGTRMYRYKAPSGSPLTRIAKVVVAAVRKHKLELPRDQSSLYGSLGPGKDAEDPASDQSARHTNQFRHLYQYRFLDKAAVLEPSDDEIYDENPKPWRLCTVTQIEEVKMVLRLLPIWATTITFYTVYAQMLTFSVVQGSKMDRKMGSFLFPSASSAAFLFATIMVTVTVYDRFIVPLMRKLTGHPQGITTLQRIGVGLVVAILAMVVAAMVERRRVRIARENKLLDSPDVPVPMSVLWILPQYVLVGIGEAFTYIGQLEFFYRESPDGMQSLGVGLFLSTISLGFFLSSFLVSVVDSVTRGGGSGGWIANNLNRSRLDDFYWLLAVVSSANLVLYLICARWYKYRRAVSHSTGTSAHF